MGNWRDRELGGGVGEGEQHWGMGHGPSRCGIPEADRLWCPVPMENRDGRIEFSLGEAWGMGQAAMEWEERWFPLITFFESAQGPQVWTVGRWALGLRPVIVLGRNNHIDF